MPSTAILSQRWHQIATQVDEMSHIETPSFEDWSHIVAACRRWVKAAVPFGEPWASPALVNGTLSFLQRAENRQKVTREEFIGMCDLAKQWAKIHAAANAVQEQPISDELADQIQSAIDLDSWKATQKEDDENAC